MKLVLPEWLSETLYQQMLADWGTENIVPAAARPGALGYAAWLQETIKSRTIVPPQFVPSTLLFMTDDAETKIYGMVHIRHTLNDALLEAGGHIGYGIVPSERGKGYAKEQLRLALPVAKSLGISRALITCDDDNDASAKTIESCGGVLEDKRKSGEKAVRRYWIDIPQTVIETKRLILRGWAETDGEAMYAYAKNPKIGPAAGWKPHENLEESMHYAALFSKDPALWAIVEKESGTVIGSAGLHTDGKRSNPRARMIGYVLREESWGKGYMTEAVRALTAFGFERLCLDTISIFHYATNQRSRRVIEKCGYHFEGVIRRASSLFDGSVQDDCCWSLLRDAYLTQKNADDGVSFQ